MRIPKLVILLVITFFVPSTAKAASITLNELGLDAIFSQASFGGFPVDVRILPSRAVDDAALLNIETSPEMSFLLFLTLSPPPVVNAYFVDSISACGSVVDPSIAGCGLLGGNSFAVESGL